MRLTQWSGSAVRIRPYVIIIKGIESIKTKTEYLNLVNDTFLSFSPNGTYNVKIISQIFVQTYT